MVPTKQAAPLRMPICDVLIVAAGSGTRFGGALPKQYRDLGGRTVLRRAIDAFRSADGIRRVLVAIDPTHRPLYDHATAGLSLAEPVAGRATRQATVLAGLETMAADPPDIVLVHDAARPLVSQGTIGRVIAALDSAPAAIAALPVVDTVKREQDGHIEATVDRRHLWLAQTPQGFAFNLALAAHRAAADAELTDDAAVAERFGLRVALVYGDAANFKITTEDDLLRAAHLVEAPMETRTGLGFDVHRFTAGQAVTLCGVAIPHDRSLEGHSDADVALHALTDALLGAIGAGDIGVHFPPDDMRWRGADSALFLRHAAGLVAARGGRIVNVDVTILCEAPRIGPHRPAMTGRLAAILEIAPDRIGLKATTTEQLGFTGRREGVAAQAIATVRLPS
jgi:2-C-methyl-D-erythritol 4-phosphate cytidylyltransferase/2-C-methyl-D-erythritol 2,4-cyclodiphosphate synthase